MAKVIKRQPPSRIKYEQSHPTVSCRVSREIYDRLVEAKEVEGKSFADILKLGLGKAERSANKLIEAKMQSWSEGHKKGFDEAALKYKVTYHCSKCGQIMEVQHPNEKETIDELMRKAGWAHQQCPARRQ